MPTDRTASTWRTSVLGAGSLLVGLALLGVGVALLELAGLGLDPWNVLADGLRRRTGWSLGSLIIGIGVVVLLAWVPLGERPGLGTVANVALVGTVVDAVLAVAPPPQALGLRAVAMVAGIVTFGAGSGLYLSPGLGPGPRDGLMTGLTRVTGAPLSLVRAALELSALTAGWALGGTVGVGTVTYALGVGPCVAVALRLAAPLRARLPTR